MIDIFIATMIIGFISLIFDGKLQISNEYQNVKKEIENYKYVLNSDKRNKFINDLKSKIKKIDTSEVDKLRKQVNLIPGFEDFKDFKKAKMEVLKQLEIKFQYKFDKIFEEFFKNLPIFYIPKSNIKDIILDDDILEMYKMLINSKTQKDFLFTNKKEINIFLDKFDLNFKEYNLKEKIFVYSELNPDYTGLEVRTNFTLIK